MPDKLQSQKKIFSDFSDGKTFCTLKENVLLERNLRINFIATNKRRKIYAIYEWYICFFIQENILRFPVEIFLLKNIL